MTKHKTDMNINWQITDMNINWQIQKTDHDKTQNIHKHY